MLQPSVAYIPYVEHLNPRIELVRVGKTLQTKTLFAQNLMTYYTYIDMITYTYNNICISVCLCIFGMCVIFVVVALPP